MKYIITLLFTLSVLTVSAQDVKIQGPKRKQTTTSKSKQTNSANVALQRQLEEQQEQLRLEQQEQERLVQKEKEKEELARKNALRWDESRHTLCFMGQQYEMVLIDGGSFLMGAREQDLKSIEKNINSGKALELITIGSSNSNTSSFNGQHEFRNAVPTHSVSVNPFYIGKIEVTGALWNAVMGTNYNSSLPFGKASWYDCQQFIEKLNQKVGVKFRLPTEAEWEFAARGGTKSCGYCYSGSNMLYNVSINGRDISQPGAASKSPNELGLYDMSGSVWEWCQDWYGAYSSQRQINPKGPNSGSEKIMRGGNYHEYGKDINCCVAYRRNIEPTTRSSFNDQGLRLCLDVNNTELSDFTKKQEAASKQYALRWDDTSKTFYYNGQSYKMIKVDGGTFEMGMSKEQKKTSKKEVYNETKGHSVTLSTYYIGQTEFTRGFLRALQGDCTGPLPDDLLPVGMSWDYSKLVVDYLSKVTGCNFCIPTEAEWEFAARGGNRSHGYSMSGCNHYGHTVDRYIEDSYYYAVSNSLSNGPDVKVPMKNVASKKPNELGIYDMSGNVWEWCADWYAKYETKAVTNPMGPSTGTMRVYRGGSHVERVVPRVYERFCDYPDKSYSNVGFRLCLRP